MHSEEIRKKFLAFFEKRGHKVVPSASLIPENDPSVLFNTAGMQPLVPYLLGQKHPLGNRIVNVQKCVRTGDLDDIGDNRHFSFFEMMGNWSLGDYFKEEAIKWSYEFLTSKEEGLGLDPTRLYITVFAGDENAPEDIESRALWQSVGVSNERIYSLGADDNWWSPGDNGPCGPCSEMFYDVTGTVGELSKEQFVEAVKKEDVIEIWNDVFMEYEKKDGKVVGKLAQKNVDTGAGLERMTAVLQGKKTAYETDIFKEALEKIKNDRPKILGSEEQIIKAERIVLDHFRTVLFLAADGVVPSNKGAGYIMRRLLRRGIVYFRKISFVYLEHYAQLLDVCVGFYGNIYPELKAVKENGYKIIFDEINQFQNSLENGLKEFEKLEKRRFWGINGAEGEKMMIILGQDAFDLWQTYGFPIELTIELATERNMKVDVPTFDFLMKQHQEKSRTASSGMFKGGLANTNEKTVRLHTAHHLLLAALQEKFGKQVKQRGSNITEERLRMDFVFDRKITDEEKKELEAQVNTWINEAHPVVRREMPLAEAEKLGAEMEFGAKYPDMVSVYMIGKSDDKILSKEFCGGPHVTNTKELGHFKIQKEEASSQGVRRIKAVLE